MFRDPLVQKAWDLSRQTAECPLEAIIKATTWLEEKHRQAPHSRTAIIITVQYLILAMRRDLREPEIAKGYFLRAARWREEASRWMSGPNPLATGQSRN